MSVYDEIVAERARQDGKWGGAEHDDQHGGLDWSDWISRYAGWAGMMWHFGNAEGLLEYRRRVVQIAALAVAAVESFDRRYPQLLEDAHGED